MPLSTESCISPEVRQAVMRYLSERLDDPTISTDEAVKTLRQRLPECALTDREIIDLIAKKAAEAGFNINFDGDGRKT